MRSCNLSTSIIAMFINKDYCIGMCIMTSLGDRIRRARESKGWSQSDLARAAGCKPQTIQALEDPEKNQRNSKYLPDIARALGWDALALRDGGASESPKVEQLSDNNVLKVPLMGDVAAGVWHEGAWPEEVERYVMFGEKDRFAGADLFAVRVMGPSMNKEYREGDVLICLSVYSGTQILSGDHVIIERRKNQGETFEHTVKEVQIDKDGSPSYWPRSTDPRWQDPIRLTDGNGSDDTVEAAVIGIVVGLSRTLR